MLRQSALPRLLVAIPSLLIASVIVFSLARLIPGDVVTLMMEENQYAQDLAEMRAKLGLDRSIHTQYVDWMGRAAGGAPAAPRPAGVLLRLEPADRVHRVRRRPVAARRAVPAPGALAGRRVGGLDHAADADPAAGGAAPGLRAHRVVEGARRAPRGPQGQPEERPA